MRALALADLNERLPEPGNPFTLEVVDPNERVIEGGTDAGEESGEPGSRNSSVAAAAASTARSAAAAAAAAAMAAGGGGGPIAVSFSPAADDRPAAAIAAANAAADAAAQAAAARSAIPIPADVQTPPPSPQSQPIVMASTPVFTPPQNPAPPMEEAGTDPPPAPANPCPSDEPCDGVVIPGAPSSVGGVQLETVLASSKFLARRSGSKSSLTGTQLLAIRNANIERVCQEQRRRGIHPPECRNLLTPHLHR